MKYFKKHHLFLFWFPYACIFISISCNKDKNIFSGVSGTVLDKTTNTPVAEAEVALFEKDAEIFGGLGGVMLESKFADANGSFHFDFTERNGYNYYVQAIKSQYWNDQSSNITFVHYGEEDVIVYLQPEGYLKIYINNVNIYEPSDHISVNGTIESGFYGNEVDTSVIILTLGSLTHQLSWFIYHDGSIENDVDYIYTPAFDTTYYSILY